MSLLAITDLSLSIHGADILRDVSLSIAAGEVVAVTGESGSGKSMTALAIMQLLPDGSETHGAVVLDGQNVTELSETEMCALRGAQVGMVFQEPMTALNPVQTIGAQVAETVQLHRPDLDATARAAEVLVRVGLDGISPRRYPHELSGGQRQRVVIAIAIACGPKLLIADEPTTALDVTTQAQILDLLVQLAREDGMGLLMITHDLAVVAQMADRITVMQHGAVVETGNTAALLAAPEHPYTQALFAA
jgi:peptide/nickel transport system ATP-binding protein